MEKRYQVFVSSTYADLQEERQEVMQALLELECIPAGMELFPAANEDQWTLIKQVIDDCDYYIVIIAGRYGSIGTEGLSYTEMEYRYALDSGKPVIGFIHKSPGTLPANRCEPTDDGKEKLKSFQDFVKKKVCRFWDSPADLGSQVSRSLVNLIKSHPGVGWVRGNLIPEKSALEEILQLRKRVEELEAQLEASRSTAPEGTTALAQGSDTYELRFSYLVSKSGYRHDAKWYAGATTIPWDQIFASVAPLMINEASDHELELALSSLARSYEYSELAAIKQFAGHHFLDFVVDKDDFQTIKVQLRALGLMAKNSKARSVKDTGTYWTLTPYGDNVMTRLRAISRHKPDTDKR